MKRSEMMKQLCPACREIVRAYTASWSRSTKARRKKAGLCPRCGRPIEKGTAYKQCSGCRDQNRERLLDFRERREKAKKEVAKR